MNIHQNLNYKQNNSRYRHYFSRLNRLYQKPVARVSSALLLTIFTIIFFAAFAIRPTLATISELIRKIDDQKEVLADLKKKSAVLGSVQNEYILVSDRVPVLDAAIPTQPNSKELLKMIEALASVHQLPISSINVQDSVFSDKTDKAAENEVALTISLEGNYKDLKSFLEDIYRLPRFVIVDSIKFTPPATETDLVTGDIRMTIGVRAYFAEDE